MGIKLIVWALDETPPDLTPREVLALVAVAESARDTTRTGWPGLAEIARRIRLSESGARKVLYGLTERGLIERIGGGRRGQSTVYRLPVATRKVSAQTDTYREAIGVQNGAVRCPSETRKVSAQTDTLPSVPSINPHPRARTDEEHDDFLAAMETPRARPGEIAAVIDALRDRTGQTIDKKQAARVVEHITGDANGSIRDRARYITAAIAKDGNPRRFLPTPQPPRFQREH